MLARSMPEESGARDEASEVVASAEALGFESMLKKLTVTSRSGCGAKHKSTTRHCATRARARGVPRDLSCTYLLQEPARHGTHAA